MARETALSTGAGKGTKMGSTFAAMAMSAFAMGAPSAPAQASIPPRAVADAVKAYNIPAGSMAAALNAFADRNGLHLLYDASATRHLKSSGLSGVYSVRQGLDRLLEGSGLAYSFASMDGTVSIVLAQNDTGAQTDANGGITLPTVEVTANQQGTAGAGGEGAGGTGCGSYGGAPCSGFGGAGLAQDPFNTSYVLPDASVGTKTDTPVMETPVNVQTVTQQVLQDQQDITLQQALQNVSGVTVSTDANGNNGHPYGQIILRGFATSNYYLDGFRVDGGSYFNLSNTQLGNVASLEVLKGPAAILYGASEPGGIVNVITKEPLNTPYFAVNQQIGSLAQYRTTIDATGPVTDDKAWLYRMTMSYFNDGAPFGSIKDFITGNTFLLAPVLKWNIDGATWVKLQVTYQDQAQGNYQNFTPIYNNQFVTIPRSTNYNEYFPEDFKTLFAALTWSHLFNKDWSIQQQFAFFRGANSVPEYLAGYIPNPSAPVPVFAQSGGLEFNTQTTYSTNVNLTGHFDTFGAQHTVLMGGDFYKLNTYGIAQYPYQSWSQIDVWDPVHPGTPIPGGGPLVPTVPGREFFNPQDTAGLYVQDQIKLPDNFFVLAGARYQYIRQGGGLSGSPTFDTNAVINNAVTQEALTPRFGLLWRPQQWVSFYTTYTEGFNANTGFIYPDTPVPPTSAREAEAGVKIELFDGKLRGTADYYDLTKTNIPTTDPNPLHQCAGGGPNSCSLVTGAARSKGPEVDIQGEILPGWSATVAYTNQDVIVTKGGNNYYQLPGQRFEGIPRNVGNFWTTYAFQDETFRGLKIGGGVTYHGSQPIQVFSSATGANLQNQLPLLPAYAIVNLMAAYDFKIGDTKMNAQVNVSNLLNHTYYTDAYYSPATGYPTPGLTFGGRSYGAPFSVIGSLSAQWPGDPSSPLSVPPLPPVPVFTWTGPYLGGQIGVAWGDNAGTAAYTTPGGFTSGFIGTGPLEDVAQGVIGGVHVGYDYQINQWVIGVEGSADGSTLYKKAATGFGGLSSFADESGNPLGGTVGGFVKSYLQGSIRARAGYAFDRLLIYGTGGIAFGAFTTDVNIQAEDAVPGTVVSGVGTGEFFWANGSRSMARVGWTAGGGVEYALNNNWSVRGEYRYSDFGQFGVSPASGVPGLAYSVNRHLAQNQVETGFSYKFDSFAPEAGSPPPPPPVPAITWTGVYLGGQIGLASGDNSGYVSYVTPGGLFGPGPLEQGAQGAIGGARIGYNYQINQWVIGLEGTVDGTNLNRNAANAFVDPTGATDANGNNFGGTVGGFIKSNIQGSIRARAGFAVDHFLIYGTGGAAFGAFTADVNIQGEDAVPGTVVAGVGTGETFYANGSRSTAQVGWTAGGGVEFAINNNWSAQVEYRYSNFGQFEVSPASPVAGLASSATRQLVQNQVQFGFSYKLDSFAPEPIVAKY